MIRSTQLLSEPIQASSVTAATESTPLDHVFQSITTTLSHPEILQLIVLLSDHLLLEQPEVLQETPEWSKF